MATATSIIRRARLTDGRVVDITTADGLIDSIEPSSTAAGAAAADEVDLGERLLLAAPAEPHAHVDKALTAEMVPNPTGDLRGAIDAWIAAAQAGLFTHDDMVIRIRAALDRLLCSGVTVVRSHINCGSGSGITHLLAAREAVAPYRDLMHVEFVALMNTPMTGADGAANRRALRDALEAGVDVVGGCPHLEPDGVGSIDVTLEAAAEAGLPVDLHVDETLDTDMLTLRDLARRMIERDHPTRVTASHCVSLGMQTTDVQQAVAAEVAEAGISIVALPQTNLFLQGRDHPVAMPRGLTAVHALREAGVVVAAGADNVQDPFNLVGRSDPLETAALMVMAGHVLPDSAYEMVGNDVRRALGLPPVTFAIGDPADFMAIDAPSIRAAIADAPADRMTFRAGRLVASTATDRTIHR